MSRKNESALIPMRWVCAVALVISTGFSAVQAAPGDAVPAGNTPPPAAPEVPAYVDGNVNYLGTLGTETMVYKAVTKKLEAQLQALAKQIEVERLTPSLARAKKSPSLIGVEGSAAKLIAVIRVLPGADIEAKVGDVLPDGSKVVRINFDSVTIAETNGRKKRVLTVAEPVHPGAVGEIFGINTVPTMGSSASSLPPPPPPRSAPAAPGSMPTAQ